MVSNDGVPTIRPDIAILGGYWPAGRQSPRQVQSGSKPPDFHTFSSLDVRGVEQERKNKTFPEGNRPVFETV